MVSHPSPARQVPPRQEDQGILQIVAVLLAFSIGKEWGQAFEHRGGGELGERR